METAALVLVLAVFHGIGIGLGLAIAAEVIRSITSKGRALILTYSKIDKAGQE